MRIKLSPQVSGKKIEYTFSGETILTKHNGQEQIFDLSFINTVLEFDIEEEQYIGISCNFGFMPIINAYRDTAGQLCVELLNFISRDATEAEKYPDWLEI